MQHSLDSFIWLYSRKFAILFSPLEPWPVECKLPASHGSAWKSFPSVKQSSSSYWNNLLTQLDLWVSYGQLCCTGIAEDSDCRGAAWTPWWGAHQWLWTLQWGGSGVLGPPRGSWYDISLSSFTGTRKLVRSVVAIFSHTILEHVYGHSLSIVALRINSEGPSSLIGSMKPSIVKWQALLGRHFIVAYLRTQTLLPFFKMWLKRCVPKRFILLLSRLLRVIPFALQPKYATKEF